MKKQTKMRMSKEVKYSVVYSSVEPNPVVRAVYVMKEHLPRPFPSEIVLTISMPEGDNPCHQHS